MTKSRIASFLGSLALLGTLFVVLPGLGADEKKEPKGKDGLYRPLGLFTEVLSLVKGNYVEKVEVRPLLTGAFSGMTEAMDPFSEYVPPQKMAAFEAARAAREKFDQRVAGLYDQADAAAGGVYALSRTGERVFAPLASLTMVAVANPAEDLEHAGRTDQARELRGHWETKVRYFASGQANLFGSEYPFDSTGFESTHAFARYAAYFQYPFQKLAREAYENARPLYQHLFERKPLDWIVESHDPHLGDAVLHVLWILARWDFTTVRGDLLSGKYNSPVRIVAFNTLEHWSEDVSSDIAAEIQMRCDIDGVPVPEHLTDFMESHARPARQLSLRLV